MFTADQIVAHLVGDYILQSQWMSDEKTKRNTAAAVHAACYTLPFLFITFSIPALAVIAGTHFLIDRYRLARFVVSWKNKLGDFGGGNRSTKYETPTGYPAELPPFLAVWLLIIADNTMHILINGAALRWLA